MEKLKEIARNRKIRGFSRLKKEDLVNKIEESLLDEDFAYEFFKKIDK
ncbi:MAG: Rho termination factor N-terminal domain-containing protein, partial [Clostridia bacterium]